MNRTEVYKVIDTERDYQDKLQDKNDWEHQGHPSVTEELVMMQEYLNRARTAWVNNKGDIKALDMLRKVVGIGVRCFENHTVSPRKDSGEEWWISIGGDKPEKIMEECGSSLKAVNEKEEPTTYSK